MTKSTYRFAVIGFGRRGRYHMESLEAMEDATVRCVAVADPRDPTAEEEEPDSVPPSTMTTARC